VHHSRKTVHHANKRRDPEEEGLLRKNGSQNHPQLSSAQAEPVWETGGTGHLDTQENPAAKGTSRKRHKIVNGTRERDTQQDRVLNRRYYVVLVRRETRKER